MKLSERKKFVCGKLLKLFQLMSINKRIDYIKNNTVILTLHNNSILLKITQRALYLPIQKISNRFFNYVSPISDSFIHMKNVSIFIQLLTDANAINQLDHVGFCYPSTSIQEEKQIASDLVGKYIHAYEVKSNDFAKWLFIGNIKTLSDPLIELLPTRPNHDQEIDYWLPNIHIDLNTNLSSEIIKKMLRMSGMKISATYQDAWGIHCVRSRLGSIAGINIDLDVSTKIRNIPWVRTHLYKKIS